MEAAKVIMALTVVRTEHRRHRGKETEEEAEKRLMAVLVAAVVEKAPQELTGLLDFLTQQVQAVTGRRHLSPGQALPVEEAAAGIIPITWVQGQEAQAVEAPGHLGLEPEMLAALICAVGLAPVPVVELTAVLV